MDRPHPILALWAHPRSMSTATERIMRERGDMTVFHEPFMAEYYIHSGKRAFPHQDLASGPTPDYDAARAAILAEGQRRPVFFKDMSFYALDRMLGDGDFARRLDHVFLIRDPRMAFASYAKLDPGFTREEAGIEAQWRHFEYLRDVTGAAPTVIRAEDVTADPKGVIGKLWARAGLPFAAHAFDWEDGDVPEDWETVKDWHGDVLGSGGIRADTRHPDAVFERAAARTPAIRAHLAHHQPFYDRLAAEALA